MNGNVPHVLRFPLLVFVHVDNTMLHPFCGVETDSKAKLYLTLFISLLLSSFRLILKLVVILLFDLTAKTASS